MRGNTVTGESDRKHTQGNTVTATSTRAHGVKKKKAHGAKAASTVDNMRSSDGKNAAAEAAPCWAINTQCRNKRNSLADAGVPAATADR